jgi:hypothetical protein
MMNFNNALTGVTRYLEHEIYAKMTGWQEVLAKLYVSRMTANIDNLKASLMTNPFVKTLAIFDSEGNVDAEGIINDLRHLISEKGKVCISIPLLGDFTFTPDDVDKLYNIMRG